MEHMIGVAVYVCTTDTRRTKQYPFADGAECPRYITDADTGDVFQLVSRHYEVDPLAIEETQARVREWNAKRYGATVRDVIANDTATAGDAEAA